MKILLFLMLAIFSQASISGVVFDYEFSDKTDMHKDMLIEDLNVIRDMAETLLERENTNCFISKYKLSFEDSLSSWSKYTYRLKMEVFCKSDDLSGFQFGYRVSEQDIHVISAGLAFISKDSSQKKYFALTYSLDTYQGSLSEVSATHGRNRVLGTPVIK